ncbi:MAG: hypothetical protein ASARMPREDX12_001749 [Alectoria sarmentosa]|nr:MAG: hypothetical protein ASARMPREDX12_001749 [Alectoria sarmentosa]
MTPATFEMDKYMPDWTGDLDFGAFVNFPSDDVDQGDMSGLLTDSFDECHGHPLPSFPHGVCTTVTKYCNAALNQDDLYDVVAMPGPGIDQKLPEVPVGSTILNALTDGPGHECSCTACLFVGAIKDWPDHGMACRFPGCNYFTEGHSDHILHERGHFHKAGNATFHCVEQLCPFTSKRWPDLVRHYTVKHCTSPKKFLYPCPVLWCKYSGNNGFARKDKLKSHYKNIHEGRSGPAKASRVLIPATLKPQVLSSGSTMDVQKE